MLRRPWFVMLAGLATLVVAVVALVAHVRHSSGRSRIGTSGRAVERLAGCPGDIDVRFDRNGFPHVRAHSAPAAWFAQGYLHARERFFQMELSRRAGAGRLAEMLGDAALATDRKLRTWRVPSVARLHTALIDPDQREALESYAAGVNAAIDRYGRWIAPELWLLAMDPEPWTVEDSMRVGALLQLNLSWGMGEELKRAVQLARLGPERALALWGWTPEQARRWIPPVEPTLSERREEEPIRPPLSGEGSNNWAIAPSRTATGRPILANDPHLGVQLPSTWYAVHLEAPGLRVAGASIPGVPGVAIGHTGRVAWGFTMSLLDDQDLYVLTLDDQRDRELVDGAWRDLRTVTERIEVRWRSQPVLHKVRLSERGPLVRDLHRETVALAWTAGEGPSAIGAFLAMSRAGSVEDLVAAWDGVIGPSMNLVAADVDGRILHQVVGLTPDRRQGAGRLPAPGGDSRWAWRGFRPYATNPRSSDPPEGFVATANHDLFAEGPATSEPFPGDFAAPWRYRRIHQQLAARDDWDLASSLALQADVTSLRAVAFLKLLWPDLEAHGGATARRLLAWDGRMSVDSVPAHLLSRLLLELGAAVGRDEMVRDGIAATPLGPEELLRLLAGGMDDSWWDDHSTGAVEDRENVLGEVLDRMDALGLRTGWGEVHTVSFDHPLRPMPLVGHLFGRMWSRGPIPVGGDDVTVNAHYYSRSRPFAVTAIPSMRFVADVGAWDETVLVLPLGQSGRPWSPHYADHLPAWVNVRPVRFPFSDAAVEAATVSRLRLTPADRGDAEVGVRGTGS